MGRGTARQESGSVTGRGGLVKPHLGQLKAAVVFISVPQIVFLLAELPPWVQGTPAAGPPSAPGEAWASRKGASGWVPCPVGKQRGQSRDRSPDGDGQGNLCDYVVPLASNKSWDVERRCHAGKRNEGKRTPDPCTARLR